jgi:hypothetical protein
MDRWKERTSEQWRAGSAGVTRTAARFWAVDLHVHTPGSVEDSKHGEVSPGDVVRSAIAAGLDAIAITDHNTAEWCEQMQEAAKGTMLTVLPGVEISTSEGHLLGIWETGTSVQTIRDCLVELGIKTASHGKTGIAAQANIAQAAAVVTASRGLAIAAHIDGPKGLLKQEVGVHVYDTLLDRNLAAVEIVKEEIAATVAAKLGDRRTLACVRSSDAHSLDRVGARRTWVKAGAPDLCGLKHALEDPELHVRREAPTPAARPVIESVTIDGTFMKGVELLLSPEITCLVGGTGTGKSLLLEAIRYALDQQTDPALFSAIRTEVDERLGFALGAAGSVGVVFRTSNGERYRATRPYVSDAPRVTLTRQVGADWLEDESDVSSLFRVSALSQGEALELARRGVGRMAVIDAGADLAEVSAEIEDLEVKIRANAEAWLEQRDLIEKLESARTDPAPLQERIATLTALFEDDLVKNQDAWEADREVLEQLLETFGNPDDFDNWLDEAPAPEVAVRDSVDLLGELHQLQIDTVRKVGKGLAALRKVVVAANERADELTSRWEAADERFQRELDAQLTAVESGATLPALRSQLVKTQTQLKKAKELEDRIEGTEQPRLQELAAERKALFNELGRCRRERREARRARAKEVGSRTEVLKLAVPSRGDASTYADAMARLKVGSNVKEPVIAAICNRTHPAQFVESILDEQFDAFVASGVDATSVAKFVSNVDSKGRWDELLELQLLDIPDVLNVTFKTEAGTFERVETLAHGQKCTAMLVLLMCDGDVPVIVDQPEDALHAPWIEDYLVVNLRERRGDRQYLFATRSPGLVVSADAEQLVTLRADGKGSRIEAEGSIERHDLNKLALHHLEGGVAAFRRRRDKLARSTSG